jgi:hypothetical protein
MFLRTPHARIAYEESEVFALTLDRRDGTLPET